MSEEKVKAILKEAAQAKARIEEGMRFLNELRDTAQTLIASYGRERVSGGAQRSLADFVAHLDEEEKRVFEEANRLLELRKQVLTAIERISNKDSASIIRLRYFGLMEYPDIMDRLHISRTTMYRLMKKGIGELGGFLSY